jgi:hypothetical protein
MSDKLTEVEVEGLKAILSKCRLGPWRRNKIGFRVMSRAPFSVVLQGDSDDPGELYGDAAAIDLLIAARNILPKLLAERAEQAAEIKRLREEIKDAMQCLDGADSERAASSAYETLDEALAAQAKETDDD